MAAESPLDPPPELSPLQLNTEPLSLDVDESLSLAESGVLLLLTLPAVLIDLDLILQVFSEALQENPPDEVGNQLENIEFYPLWEYRPLLFPSPTFDQQHIE